MIINKEDLFKIVHLKQEVFKVPSWDNAEIVMRELTIEEAMVYTSMIKDNKPIDEAIKYALNCSMVEPTMFTDEEIKKMNAVGFQGLNEIFTNIQVIGKTDEEKEAYFKKQSETLKTPKTELSKEEEEKK
jgi:hypothetical protein